MNKRLIAAITTIIIIMVSASACIAGGEEEYTIVDDTGREVNFKGDAEKIVSLSPANTEILFALGLDEEIVGVTEYCNYPEAALDKEKVGGYSTVDVERVIELEPDVVFGEAGHEEFAQQLTDAGIPVVLFKATTLDIMMDDIELIGKVTGKEEEATTLVSDLESRVSVISSSTANIENKKKVFYVLWGDPLMSAGPGTFIDEVITTAGGINIAGEADSAWPMFDMEWLIDNDPDVIILGPHGSSGMSKEDIMSNENWATISAVQNEQIYVMSDAVIILRPGPRIVDAVEEVYSFMPTQIIVTDDLGNQYTFDSPAEKIISLAPSNTEILFALGVGDNVVGVTEFCNYPAEVLGIEKVGGFSTVNVERVIELEPDVVFATTGDEDSYQQIKDAGIPVIQFMAVDFETVYKDIRTVGAITGKDQEAYDLVMEMKERINMVEENVTNLTEKKDVFYLLWYDPIMSIGSGTFIDQIITTSGGINMAADAQSAWPVLSLEDIIQKDPDAIILAPHQASGVSKDELMANADWSTVTAIINGEVYEISNTDIINRPGPRIAEAVEELFGLLYG